MALALVVDASAERAEKVRAAGACAGTAEAALAITACPCCDWQGRAAKAGTRVEQLHSSTS
jgi:hypothetical protein